MSTEHHSDRRTNGTPSSQQPPSSPRSSMPSIPIDLRDTPTASELSSMSTLLERLCRYHLHQHRLQPPRAISRSTHLSIRPAGEHNKHQPKRSRDHATIILRLQSVSPNVRLGDLIWTTNERPNGPATSSCDTVNREQRTQWHTLDIDSCAANHASICQTKKATSFHDSLIALPMPCYRHPLHNSENSGAGPLQISLPSCAFSCVGILSPATTAQQHHHSRSPLKRSVQERQNHRRRRSPCWTAPARSAEEGGEKHHRHHDVSRMDSLDAANGSLEPRHRVDLLL